MGFVHMSNQSLVPIQADQLQEYIEQGYSRHLENQALHLAGIKGRYEHLNIKWNPAIEKEAMRRDGGGITVYLRKISMEQERERHQAKLKEYAENPMYGAW